MDAYKYTNKYTDVEPNINRYTDNNIYIYSDTDNNKYAYRRRSGGDNSNAGNSRFCREHNADKIHGRCDDVVKHIRDTGYNDTDWMERAKFIIGRPGIFYGKRIRRVVSFDINKRFVGYNSAGKEPYCEHRNNNSDIRFRVAWGDSAGQP